MKNIKRYINSPCPGDYFPSLTGVGYNCAYSMRNIINNSVLNPIWAPIRAVTKRVIKNKL